MDSNLCSYCQLQKEIIKHLFLECPVVQQFWQHLKAWLETHINVSFQTDDRTILFSIQGANKLTNYLHLYMFCQNIIYTKINFQIKDCIFKILGHC